jgi:excisionase family DNA binding protein
MVSYRPILIDTNKMLDYVECFWFNPAHVDFSILSNLKETKMSERWLSVDEIAEHLGIKRDTVYKWVAHKNMPAHKVGRLLKFQIKEVDEWVRTGNASSKNEEQ